MRHWKHNTLYTLLMKNKTENWYSLPFFLSSFYDGMIFKCAHRALVVVAMCTHFEFQKKNVKVLKEIRKLYNYFISIFVCCLYQYFMWWRKGNVASLRRTTIAVIHKNKNMYIKIYLFFIKQFSSSFRELLWDSGSYHK